VKDEKSMTAGVGRFYRQGDKLRGRGKLEEAVKAFEQGLMIDPDHLQSLNDMGIALHDLGRTEDALAAYRRVLGIDPDYVYSLNNIANALHDHGAEADAMAAYQRALEIDPDFEDAIYNLAVVYQEKGANKKAANLFQRLLRLDPDHATARHLAAALSGATTARAPQEYVQNLFDDYAESFEAELTGDLDYRTPKALQDLLRRQRGRKSFFNRALDLGCGTGLMGQALRSHVARLHGIDLSTGMLKQAESKGIYDKLMVGDLAERLQKRGPKYDLFAAADVLVYLGELDDLFAAVRQRAATGALFLFSTELCRKAGYQLGASGRYQHSRGYIRAMARQHGMSQIAAEDTDLRQDSGRPVRGQCHLYAINADG